MSAVAKLAAFAAVLAALFGAATLAGAALDPDRDDESPAEHADAGDDSHNGGHGASGEAPAQAVRGLAVADGGLRLDLPQPEFRRGEQGRLAYRILDGQDQPVRAFEVEHERRMHTIVVRRDLTGFQHIHPEMAADGTWSVPLRLADPGSYRVFADFVNEGTAVTLASDLRVDGDADLRPLPAPTDTARSDGGDDVRLDGGQARAGKETTLRFAITRDGEDVHVEPYLGADGHLVALREGDLAFLHVHPVEGGEGAQGHDDAIAFATTFPTPGRYRLFLQFRDAGSVRTVAFTQEVTR